MLKTAYTAVIFGLLLTLGCQQKSTDDQKMESQLSPQQTSRSVSLNKPEKKTVPNQSRYKGTIRFLNLEGGFYGIVTQEGQKLLPVNLPKEYRQAGALVEISGVFLKETVTIQQWGSPFRIDEIKLIKAGKKPNTHEI